MTDKELVERLRKGDTPMANHYMDEAADRIEALTAKIKLMDDLDVINGEKIEALTAKLAKAVEALREIAGECGCSTARAMLAEIEGKEP
jgi:hypothetical protein